MKLTKNFNKEEFDSKDGACMPNDVLNNIAELAKNVQIIRDYVGVPLTINSGYRSPAHNKSVGGVDNSYHVQGKASDLSSSKITPKKLYDAILKLIADGKVYNGGVGIYNTFVHYDIGGKGRRWDYRK